MADSSKNIEISFLFFSLLATETTSSSYTSSSNNREVPFVSKKINA
jgi:hypothetical protein